MTAKMARMKLHYHHWILAAVNIALCVIFGSMFVLRLNYEFIIYVGVILFFLCLIGFSLRWIHYTPMALVGLTIWSALHLAGGAVPIGQGRLYDTIIVALSQEYPILRYDQIVHIWGFGVSTIVMYCLLKPSLRRGTGNVISLAVVLAMAGLGVGALNEILEFIVTIAVPESCVGGYLNTSLDLCSDLIGAAWGVFYILVRYRENQENQEQSTCFYTIQ